MFEDAQGTLLVESALSFLDCVGFVPINLHMRIDESLSQQREPGPDSPESPACKWLGSVSTPILALLVPGSPPPHPVA